MIQPTPPPITVRKSAHGHNPRLISHTGLLTSPALLRPTTTAAAAISLVCMCWIFTKTHCGSVQKNTAESVHERNLHEKPDIAQCFTRHPNPRYCSLYPLTQQRCHRYPLHTTPSQYDRENACPQGQHAELLACPAALHHVVAHDLQGITLHHGLRGGVDNALFVLNMLPVQRCKVV